MKKNFLSIIMSLVMTFSCCSFLVGCGDSGKEDTGNNSEYNRLIVIDPSLTQVNAGIFVGTDSSTSLTNMNGDKYKDNQPIDFYCSVDVGYEINNLKLYNNNVEIEGIATTFYQQNIAKPAPENPNLYYLYERRMTFSLPMTENVNITSSADPVSIKELEYDFVFPETNADKMSYQIRKYTYDCDGEYSDVITSNTEDKVVKFNYGEEVEIKLMLEDPYSTEQLADTAMEFNYKEINADYNNVQLAVEDSQSRTYKLTNCVGDLTIGLGLTDDHLKKVNIKCNSTFAYNIKPVAWDATYNNWNDTTNIVDENGDIYYSFDYGSDAYFMFQSTHLYNFPTAFRDDFAPTLYEQGGLACQLLEQYTANNDSDTWFNNLTSDAIIFKAENLTYDATLTLPPITHIKSENFVTVNFPDNQFLECTMIHEGYNGNGYSYIDVEDGVQYNKATKGDYFYFSLDYNKNYISLGEEYKIFLDKNNNNTYDDGDNIAESFIDNDKKVYRIKIDANCDGDAVNIGITDMTEVTTALFDFANELANCYYTIGYKQETEASYTILERDDNDKLQVSLDPRLIYDIKVIPDENYSFKGTDQSININIGGSGNGYVAKAETDGNDKLKIYEDGSIHFKTGYFIDEDASILVSNIVCIFEVRQNTALALTIGSDGLSLKEDMESSTVTVLTLSAGQPKKVIIVTNEGGEEIANGSYLIVYASGLSNSSSTSATAQAYTYAQGGVNITIEHDSVIEAFENQASAEKTITLAAFDSDEISVKYKKDPNSDYSAATSGEIITVLPTDEMCFEIEYLDRTNKLNDIEIDYGYGSQTIDYSSYMSGFDEFSMSQDNETTVLAFKFELKQRYPVLRDINIIFAEYKTQATDAFEDVLTGYAITLDIDQNIIEFHDPADTINPNTILNNISSLGIKYKTKKLIYGDINNASLDFNLAKLVDQNGDFVEQTSYADLDDEFKAIVEDKIGRIYFVLNDDLSIITEMHYKLAGVGAGYRTLRQITTNFNNYDDYYFTSARVTVNTRTEDKYGLYEYENNKYVLDGDFVEINLVVSDKFVIDEDTVAFNINEQQAIKFSDMISSTDQVTDRETKYSFLVQINEDTTFTLVELEAKMITITVPNNSDNYELYLKKEGESQYSKVTENIVIEANKAFEIWLKPAGFYSPSLSIQGGGLEIYNKTNKYGEYYQDPENSNYKYYACDGLYEDITLIVE